MMQKTCYLLAFMFLSGVAQAQPEINQRLVGIWQCQSYDITVEVYNKGKFVHARLVDFPCNHKPPVAIKDHKDIHNSNVKMRSRNLQYIDVLWNLEYDGNNKWTNGRVYLPPLGQVYSASATLLSANKVKIAGYLGFEFLGSSLDFVRVP